MGQKMKVQIITVIIVLVIIGACVGTAMWRNSKSGGADDKGQTVSWQETHQWNMIRWA